jgi:hypothetical protein
VNYLRMADAAFAANIPPGFDIAAGYFGGPNAYNVWQRPDWDRFPGLRLPIWVCGYDGAAEGAAAAGLLKILGVPGGAVAVADMETRVDRTYLEAFGAELAAAGYKTWVYGSAGTVFGNPQLNGYWVADYVANPLPVLTQTGVRAVQFAPDLAPGYDESWVKPWTATALWHGQAPG